MDNLSKDSLVYKGRLKWRSSWGRFSDRAECRIRIYKAAKDAQAFHLIEDLGKLLRSPDRFRKSEPIPAKAIVVVSESGDVEGGGITNGAGILFNAVCDRFDFDPSGVVWVEHYAIAGEEDTYDRVFFGLASKKVVWENTTFKKVVWENTTLEAVKALIK